jgi:hypothetical protein
MTSSEMQTLTAYECIGMADLEPHMVRDEGFRRQEIAMRKLAKLQKQVDAAKKTLAEAGMIAAAGMAEMAKAV